MQNVENSSAGQDAASAGGRPRPAASSPSSLAMIKQLRLEQLRNEHRALDQRIVALEHHRSHTPDEENELHRLKKLKLLTKDRMTEIAQLRRA